MHLLTHEGLYLSGCVAARSRDAQVGGLTPVTVQARSKLARIAVRSTRKSGRYRAPVCSDRAFGRSTSSTEQLGSLSGRLAQYLLTQMAQFATAGTVVEVMESQALIARRG